MSVSTPAMEMLEGRTLLSDVKDETCQSKEVEAIAIIGLSITFPQNITSLGSLWETLVGRKSAMTEFPKSRLNLDAFYDPDTERVNGVRRLIKLLFTKPTE